MLQIQNQNGAAVNALSRVSRVVAANFFIVRQGNKIPADKLQEIKKARRGVKPRLDSHPELVLTEATMCDRKTTPIIIRTINKGGTLWGKTFSELTQSMLETYKKELGL